MIAVDLNRLKYVIYERFLAFHTPHSEEAWKRTLTTVARLEILQPRMISHSSAEDYCHRLLDALVGLGRDSLLIYLAALKDPIALHLGPNDCAWIDDMRATLIDLSDEQWECAFVLGAVVSPAQQAETRAKLARSRAEDARDRADETRSDAGGRRLQFDHDRLLIDCDLAEPCDALAARLGRNPPAGIYSFALAGDQGLLKDFVLPRMQRELLRIAQRAPTRHNFWAVPAVDGVTLRPQDVSAQNLPWREQFHAFAADRGVNHLVVAWSDHRLPPDEVAEFAACLEAEVFPALRPAVEKNDQVFIVMWADVARPAVAPKPCYTCLPLPDRLPTDEVVRHFRRTLPVGLEDQDREAALAAVQYCLDVTEGWPQTAFPGLRDVVERLKGEMS